MIDELFQAWKSAEAGNNPDLKASTGQALFKQLQGLARAVVWNTLYIHDPDLVQDIVSHAFLKAYTFNGLSTFSTWFWRLAYNKCLRSAKRKQGRREISLDTLLWEPEQTPQKFDIYTPALARLQRELPPEDWEFLQQKVQRRSQRELSAIFGMKFEGVASRWTRIKERARKILEGELDGTS